MSPLPLYATPGKPETALVLIQHQMNQPAQIVLSQNLRLSGLIRCLPLDLLQVFITLLTFYEARGEVRASIEQLSEALEIHPDQIEAKLIQLAAYTFEDAPLLYPSSERVYALSKRVGVPVDITPPAPPEPIHRSVPRELIIELSRRKYATPRAEAEAMIDKQLAKTLPEPIPEGREGEAYMALIDIGVSDADARSLLAEFPIESIEEQIEWLPRRGARNPARFVVAAIRGGYASPDVPRA